MTIVVRNNNPLLDSTDFDLVWRQLAEQFPLIAFMLFNDGYNTGFGGGHNLNFASAGSDYILILNDDIGLPNLDWLDEMLIIFKNNDTVGAVGALENPTSVTPFFANGVHERFDLRWPLQYAEASILLLRSEAFAKIGGFDKAYIWAMFEDADLSFRLKANGYQLSWVAVPHQHWRSSSVNALPGQIRQSVLQSTTDRSSWRNGMLRSRRGVLAAGISTTCGRTVLAMYSAHFCTWRTSSQLNRYSEERRLGLTLLRPRLRKCFLEAK